ncbi:MAG: PhnD/SsuA/transferrin family substrate-binding protein, partial [Guyparkeria sp.]
MSLVVAFLCLLIAPPIHAQPDEAASRITIGVLAYAGKEEALERWQATADYLSYRNPGYRFVIEPLFLSELRRAFVQRQLHFVLTQSLQYSELSRLGTIWPLSTLVAKGNGQGLSGQGRGDQALEQLGAVIFTREGSGFDTLDDLVGTRIAGTSPNALGGWLLGMQALENAGIEVGHEITPIFTGLPLEAVIDAVLDGRAHAGVVRASFFQRYLEAYPDTRLLPVGPAERQGFPYPSNTPLVPEWPFAATGQAPDGLPAQVARQLIEMSADSPAAELARIAGWRTPLDYSIVDRLRDEWLPEPLTPGSLLLHFWHYLVLIVAAALVLFTWQARRATKRLGEEKRRLRRAFSGLHTGAALTDASGHILLTNPAIEKFARPELGGQMGGTAFCEVFELRIGERSTPCTFADLVEWGETSEEPSVDGLIERENQRLDVNLKVSRLATDGASQYLVSMLDVTDLRSANALLTYRATHDRLTGVLNREAMEEFLAWVMPGKLPRNEPVQASCLVWTDLDEFRLLNEIGSRELGDRILASLASHFSLELPSDAVLARMGVDEFAIWMPLLNHDTCALVARGVLEIIHAFRLPGEHEHLRLKASVGVTRLDSDDLIAARRLEDAERACQSAHRLGGDRVVQFSGENTELLEREQQVERYTALRAAIVDDRLHLAAQRIAPTRAGIPVLHEMLLRVTDAEGKIRFPTE